MHAPSLLLGIALVATPGACTAPRLRQPDRAPATLTPALAGLDLLVPIPDENPLTHDAVALGKRLFFDCALSADGSVRCSSCHQPERGFSDSLARSRGVYGRRGQRNAPTLVNRAYGRSFFWDGRTATLEQQVLLPIQDTLEMGEPLAALITRLRGDPSYVADFRRAFGGEADAQRVARALASFVRMLRSGNSPFDRWRNGDSSALSISARRGFALFTGRANCVACHVGANFTDEQFHNTGVAARTYLRDGTEDPGRARVTALPADRGAFKTPTLRDVALTTPYMHDGSFETLEQVVAFYDGGGHANPQLDPEIKPLALKPRERSELIDFLMALTGRRY